MTSDHDSRAGRRRRNSIAGKFIAIEVEVMQSTPWRALTLTARRVLDRVCLELRDNGGYQDSPKHKGLCVTYQDFDDYGIDRHAIGPALREVVELGFLEIVQLGRAGNAEWRRPSRFHLTFINSQDIEPLHSWKRHRHKSLQEVKAIAAKARSGKTFSSGGKHTEVGGETPTETDSVFSGGNHTTVPVGDSPLRMISAGDGRSGGGGGSVCHPSGHAGRSAGAGPGHGHATGPKPATATVTKTKPMTVSVATRPTTVNRPTKVASSVRAGPQLVRRRIGMGQRRHDDEIEMKFYPGDID